MAMKAFSDFRLWPSQGLRGFLSRRLCGLLHRAENTAARIRQNLEETRIWCTREEAEILKRNRQLKDRHRGLRCFVIGNGPSLNRQDLGPLQDQLTFVMSGFWKHPILSQWQPNYYCFADPLFFDGSAAMGRFFADLRGHVRQTTYLLPLSARKIVAEQGLVPGPSIHYASFQGAMDRCRTRRVDLSGHVPGVTSVAQFAIMSAIYMGCSPIYLMGLDHDWLARREQEGHFYPGKTIEGHPAAHGDLARIPYKHDLIDVLRLWEGYERLRIIANAHQCEILNATEGGFLDVFPRVRYEMVIKESAAGGPV
jgi:hypothetical protein